VSRPTVFSRVGIANGGIVAQHLAAARPDLVRRLVLVATTPGWGAAVGRPFAMAAITTPLRYYSRWYLGITNRFTSGHGERDPDFLKEAAQLRRLHRPDVLAYYGQLVAANTSSSLRRLPTITHPTLVVHGSDDPIVPAANGYLIASRMPEAHLLVAEGDGHMLLHRAGGRASVAINDFLVAADHRDSAAWAASRVVTAAEARKVMRSADLRAAQPAGALHAMVRRLSAVRSPSCTAG